MYLWNIEKLSIRLRTENISVREIFLYLLGINAFFAIVPFLNLNGESTPSPFGELGSAIVGVSVTITGLFICYFKIKNSKSTAILDKAIPLAFVLLVRFVVLLILMTFGMVFLEVVVFKFTKDLQETIDLIHEILRSILAILYYIRLAFWLGKCVNGHAENSTFTN